MKNLLFVIGLIFGLSIISFGQITPNTSGSGESQQQARASREIDIQQNQRLNQIQNPTANSQYQIDGQRNIPIYSDSNSVVSPYYSVFNPSDLSPTRPVFLPVKLSKEQSKLLLPKIEDSTKYANFLQLPHTGLIKLMPDFDCVSKGVVRVGGSCANFFPLSNTYSFRKTTYSSKGFADVGLKDSSFFSDGLLSNGIIVLLGDVPIETVSTDSDGVKFLSDYQPATNNTEILAKTKDLTDGIQNGNYTYSNMLSALEGKTYAIRVIAYRGKIMQPNRNVAGLAYNLLESDKRNDIIAIFRVVRKESDGTLTLLWKELQRKDSPKIKLSRTEQEKYLTR